MAGTVGEYLIERLAALGVRHVFGVPGDFVLGFYDQLVQSPLEVVNTCDEQGAGFAADAYARVNGIGAVCVTYAVGGLKIANSTAQAFAERSPVVVISGAPGMNERVRDPLVHHKIRTFESQLNVFREFTVAAAILDDPQTAATVIDRVLEACLRHRRPVYLELPRDVVSRPAGASTHRASHPGSDPEALAEAVAEAVEMIVGASQPAMVAGEELHRFGLQRWLLEFIDRSGIPVAATSLSKSVISEDHPRYLGVYEGALGHEPVRRYIETSDCTLLIGANLSDVTLGINTARLEPARSIVISTDRVAIKRHVYEDVRMEDMLKALAQAVPKRAPFLIPAQEPVPAFRPTAGAAVTVKRVFECLNAFIDDETLVVAEAGDALFAGLDLRIRGTADFLSPAYYLSLGFAVPAAIGAQMADPNARPLVLVGDGAFQMTGQELSTAVRWGLAPIVVVLNNDGYGTERPMLDGPFNNILRWEYSRLPDLLGAGYGCVVETEDQLEAALFLARNRRDAYSILDVRLQRDDISPALRRLTALLGKQVR